MSQTEGKGEALPGCTGWSVHGRLSSKVPVLLFFPSPDQHLSKLRSRQCGAQCLVFLLNTSLQLRLCAGGVLSHQELCSGSVLAGLPWQEPDKLISLLENGFKLNRYQPATLRAECQC